MKIRRDIQSYVADGPVSSEPVSGRNSLLTGNLMLCGKGVAMPTGPRGEKRPADVIGAAIMVAKLATGEITEILKTKSGRVSGEAGAKARVQALDARVQTAALFSKASRVQTQFNQK
jgi:hypothetical protein